MKKDVFEIRDTIVKIYSMTIFFAMSIIFVSCSGGSGVSPSTPILPTGVTLNSSSLSLKVGETSKLVATVSPSDADDKSVSWMSSNTSIATVNSGVVTAISAGNATIIVTTVSGGKTATCSVSVNDDKISVTGIKLNTSSISLDEGETTTLSATISPNNATNKKINWLSSIPEIASVSSATSDGSITISALKEGTTTITAVSNENGSITASCTVKVNKKIIPVTGITLNSSDLNVKIGQTEQIITTILPSDATYKDIECLLDDNSIASLSVNNNIISITGLKEGSTVLTVKSKQYPNVYSTCQISVSSIPVVGLTLNIHSISIEKDSTATLLATISPTDATDKTIIWELNKNGYVSMTQEGNSAILTALKPGDVVITVISKQNPLVKDSCSIEIPVPDGGSEGTSEEPWK